MAKSGYASKIDQSVFIEMHRGVDTSQAIEALQSLSAGQCAGIISDAGLPCVADPGSVVVELAQQMGIRVVPLPGPSSIMMALMASGMNGQQFAFHGYLSRETHDRRKSLQKLQMEVAKTGITQIFMETPYRNEAMLKDILSVCQSEIRLCIAMDISGPYEYIRSQSIAEWKKHLPKFYKNPAIFVMGR
ncbi:MAG: SAM-dependent methyltransferase [Flavobacteriales bacterium]|nr:SAM-dependent methyltransferase [Flavobacteriales bacterium]